ncbi:DUF1740-domain-containing protein [Bimuria novae-zelandiae CBS 107.79]|uniref:DUF1740-domain-containing protein n=1 Tax=Bimuria novae-zelandiae CBS 107.79 TaxID=1447943 RepID=A0A6A5VMX4_9PLEO|nr:DUF1740-domain-containing protein [Bimuria novae-zelandiae CBS 107.79]
MASSVPKFTSFRPKPKDNAEPATQPPRPEKQARSEKPARGRSAERHGKSERASHPPNLSRDAAPSKVFFSDRRGDRDILKYGGIDRRDVPVYRRSGYGYVLGLPLNRKIDRELSTDKAIVLTPATKRREDRLLTKKHVTRERTKAARLIRKSDGDEPDDVDGDFIALSTTRKRKRGKESDKEGGDPDYDYRGLRETDPKNPLDSDVEYESETVVDNGNSEITARNSELVRRTKDHPEDLQAWFDLIEHQEIMMLIGRSSTELRNADRKHLADVRTSIYEQALRKSDGNESVQVKLYCGLMTEAGRAWSETQLASKWSEILQKFPVNAELWQKYLDFVQSSFAGFKYETCKATFQKCLENMQLSSTAIDTNLYLYIFSRLTSMIHQAGYQELALAIWQALHEYHALAPFDTTLPVPEALQKFEEFWDSEVPRIGENNAKGWRSSDFDDGPPVDTKFFPLDDPDPKDAFLDNFRKQEIDSISKFRYPGRTTDEIGENDPFHTVLFSDVEPFLKLLPRSCEKPAILSAFLRFCSLPALIRHDPHGDQHVVDPFLHTEVHVAPQASSHGFIQLRSKYANCPMQRFQTTPRLLFDQGFPEIPGIVENGFVREMLNLLIDDIPDAESVGEYLLAFESKFFPSEAHKTAKRLLKTRPASLRLYNAYGLVESHRNNSAKADQVFSAALSMQNGSIPLSTPGSLELFYSWVWEALRSGNAKEALWRLVSPSGKIAKASIDLDESPNQAALLRGQRALGDTCERALLSENLCTAALATSLSAVLVYLSGNQNPESTLAAFEQLTKRFASHGLSQSPAAELHAQYIAEFLTYHAEHAPIVKPALLRETLEPLIASFPDNTVLLSVYAANEARFAIDDRVRSIMHQTTDDKSRTIVGWSFAIHYETLRGEIAGSTSHSIRALFKKAEDDAGVHCPALWKQHVLFELSEANKEREKRPRKRLRKDGKKSKEDLRVEEAVGRVRDTFFRGMTHLPWCKTYMMMAFTHLGKEFLSQEDLKKVYNVMVEKELRLYVEPEGDSA